MKRIIIVFILLLSFISCDKGKSQYNEWLTGTWKFNQTEYINFYSDDVFIMNDTIQGQYEVNDENDRHIFYYYISKSEETEGFGYMYVLEIKKYEVTVKDLPLHEGDTIVLKNK